MGDSAARVRRSPSVLQLPPPPPQIRTVHLTRPPPGRRLCRFRGRAGHGFEDLGYEKCAGDRLWTRTECQPVSPVDNICRWHDTCYAYRVEEALHDAMDFVLAEHPAVSAAMDALGQVTELVVDPVRALTHRCAPRRRPAPARG